MKAVTPAVLQNFFEKTLQPVFNKNDKGRQLQMAALKGLNSAHAVPDPPAEVSSLLFDRVKEVFDILKEETNVSRE